MGSMHNRAECIPYEGQARRVHNVMLRIDIHAHMHTLAYCCTRQRSMSSQNARVRIYSRSHTPMFPSAYNTAQHDIAGNFMGLDFDMFL